MDFTKLAHIIKDRCDSLENEAQVKQGLVLPFLKELGFDPDNPLEVVPECTADVGNKKGEKVDYGLRVDGKLQILVECKNFFQRDRSGNWKNQEENTAQLKRYFDSTDDVGFGILTDGIHYQFFSDLNSSKGMDLIPFLEIDLEIIPSDEEISFLESFSKSCFNAKELKTRAHGLSCIQSIKECFKNMLTPSLDVETVKFFMKAVNAGNQTESKIEEYTNYVKKGIRIGLREYMQENLNKMLNTQLEEDTDENDDIVTTADEIQAFHIIRAMIGHEIDDLNRITYKDTASYFVVNLDNKVHKTICRLYLDGKKKAINFCDDGWESKTKVEISNLNDLYQHKDRFIAILKGLL